ncbi:hypothetical protein Tco_0023101, partial [Tanacetum coccineum]
PKGVPVRLKVGFKPAKQAYKFVPKKTNANTSRNKKKEVEPPKEVCNSNPFDVLNSVENDVDLGTNGGSSNLASDHDSEDEVASVDDEMASGKFFGFKEGWLCLVTLGTFSKEVGNPLPKNNDATKDVVAPSVVAEPFLSSLGGPTVEKVISSGNNNGTWDGNVDQCSTPIRSTVRAFRGLLRMLN